MMMKMRLVSLLLLGAMSQQVSAQTYYARERMPGIVKGSTANPPTTTPDPAVPKGYSCGAGVSGSGLRFPVNFRLAARTSSQADAIKACLGQAGTVGVCQYYYANPPGQWFTYVADSAQIISGSNYVATCTPN